MKSKKDKIISLLSVLLLIVTIIFAATYNSLQAANNLITDDSWSINITSVSVDDKVNTAFNVDVEASLTTSIVNFTMINPGDEISYNIDVANTGTMDAVLDSIIVNGNDDLVTYEISGVEIGDTLHAGGAIRIKVTFKADIEEITAIQEKVAIILNYK